MVFNDFPVLLLTGQLTGQCGLHCQCFIVFLKIKFGLNHQFWPGFLLARLLPTFEIYSVSC